MKHGPVAVTVHHQARITAANTINGKERGLVDCNAFQGSTFKHRTIPKKLNNRAVISAD
jgi:hypothetical protein